MTICRRAILCWSLVSTTFIAFQPSLILKLWPGSREQLLKVLTWEWFGSSTLSISFINLKILLHLRRGRSPDDNCENKLLSLSSSFLQKESHVELRSHQGIDYEPFPTFLASVCLKTEGYANPRESYCNYLNNYLLVREDVRLGSFGRREQMEKQIYNNNFQRSSSLLDPAFFSFVNRHDIGRLVKFVSKEIVAYIQLKSGVYVPFYDYRSASSPCNREERELLVFKQSTMLSIEF